MITSKTLAGAPQYTLHARPTVRTMRRREFATLIGGAVVYSQVAAAQERMCTIGILTGNVEADLDAQGRVRAFKESLYARRDEEKTRFEHIGNAGATKGDEVNPDRLCWSFGSDRDGRCS